MYIFFEFAICLIFAAFVVALLFAVGALLMILVEGATILERLARGIAHDASILVARQTEIVRSRLSAVEFRAKPYMPFVGVSKTDIPASNPAL